MPRTTGTVKWFEDARGYGFILLDHEQGEAFFHFKEIQANGFKSIARGQRVECWVEDGAKGLKALRVVALT